MWNLTPESVAQVKEQLKGRRAAIEARYTGELKALDSDLEEIETLVRIAHSFSVKHLLELAAAMPEPAAATPEPQAAPPESAQPPDTIAELRAEPEEPAISDVALKGPVRWRIRMPSSGEMV
jgi:hypothetical protein